MPRPLRVNSGIEVGHLQVGDFDPRDRLLDPWPGRGFTELPGGSQCGGRQLQRLVLVGDHNYSSATNMGGAGRTEFRVVDSDGFLIFSLLSARWQTGVSSGAEPGRVSRAEVRAVQQAMEMARAYYARLIEIISTEPRPSNYESNLGLIDIKNEVIAETLTVLAQGRSYRATDDTIVIDTGRIRSIAARFRPGGDMRSQYRDYRVQDGAPNLLCSPDAASALVGRLACGNTPAAGARPPCPDGLVIDLSPLKQITIDPERRLVHARPGGSLRGSSGRRLGGRDRNRLGRRT